MATNLVRLVSDLVSFEQGILSEERPGKIVEQRFVVRIFRHHFCVCMLVYNRQGNRTRPDLINMLLESVLG